MSTDESDTGEEKFETLRTLLRSPCRNLLRNILKLKFRRYDDLLAKISYERLSDASISALESFNTIKKLKFPTLCDVFRSGACDCFYGSPAIGWSSNENIPERCTGVADDILRIWRIWEENIENNVLESISNDVSNEVLSVLMDIAKRLSNHPELKDIGIEFRREIYFATDCNVEGPSADAIQVGDGNRIDFNFGSSFTGSVIVVQVGNNSKICFEVQDDCNLLEITSNGLVAAVLRSDYPGFQKLAEIASHLNIEEVNNIPELKDNNVSIKEIKPGSLIITFTIQSKETLENNIQRVFQCIFRRKEIEQLLESHGIDNIKITGYLYNPKEYCLGSGRENPKFHSTEDNSDYTATKLHFHSHLTWNFADCICDVDVFQTDLFHTLSDNDFTTEVDDNIWVIAKGSIIDPKNINFSSLARILITNVVEKLGNINFQLAEFERFEIQSMQITGRSIKIKLRMKVCLNYAMFMGEDGIILTLMRRLLSSDNLTADVKLMRIGIVLDTNIVQKQKNQKDHYENVSVNIGQFQ
ncbi:uncharacterized protein LOC134260625 [Saccostrea cucullata]|uniref:uncharacterized protein LOC134260625 n=1 Tax=Saccostrea cuccullata TaxID=36930 RepID=UPI002ED59F30